MSAGVRYRDGWAYVRCSDCGKWCRSYVDVPRCRACAVKKAVAWWAHLYNDPNQKGRGRP